MSKPLCVDLFCGLGGWTEGFLAEGFEVVGFDIEQHIYGEHRYPAQLVLQDVRTLHGRQFKDAAIIVASSPCQEFSYRAMPWKRAKALGPPELGMELFAQAGRIQREAYEAAGRYIPMIQENVRGAQKYVGRAQWHYGSYYLWGDVPALMPVASGRKVSIQSWSDFGKPGYVGEAFNHTAERETKNTGGSWFAVAHNTMSGKGRNPDGRPLSDGTKVGARVNWRDYDKPGYTRPTFHASKNRKAASARIAKIPFPLAQWIARVTLEASKQAAA